MELNQLIFDIRKRKELNHLYPEFVLFQINEFLRKNPKAKNYIDKPKSREYKQIIKEIRAQLRRFHGLFQLKHSDKFIEKINSANDIDGLKKVALNILQDHASTKERNLFYETFYEDLIKIVGKINSVLDLGCGLNPFSLFILNEKLKKGKLKNYYAYDINELEIKFINSLFSKIHELNKKFNGVAGYLNLLELDNILNLSKSDVAFLFKVTDILDQGKGHKMTESVIDAIPSKTIVLSFPTKTMSGKEMTAPMRNWVKLLCERRKWEYSILQYETELFYVVVK
jgi:16S rRNA (guanine(1405)-N(7))-methyltransferase